MSDMEKPPPCIFFGCYQRAGHYLRLPHGGSVSRGSPYQRLEYLDGKLPPQGDRNTPYVAALSRLGGFGLSALSWWDNTIDKRPGSSATFFVPSMTCSVAAIVEAAKLNFPEIWSRFPAITLPE